MSKLRISVKVDDQTANRFRHICDIERITQELLLVKLIDCYEIHQGYEREYDHLREAVGKMQTTTSAFIRVAIETYINKALSNHNDVRGDAGAYKFLGEMIEANNTSGEHCYINAYTFREYVRKVNDGRHVLNSKVISRCLQLHSDKIAKYHQAHNLTVNYNREKARFKQIKTV